MRFRYFGAMNGRTLLSALIIICIMPVAVGSGSNFIRRHLSAVKKDVTFQGRNVGGMLPEEVRTVVEGVANALSISPVDAREDTETDGVIPGLDGLKVDVETTVAAIMKAKRKEAIEPFLVEVSAGKTLEDFPEHAVYSGNPVKPQVTFLINVAWGNEYLPGMLEVLQAENAQATFFLVGRWARQFKDIAKTIADAGFEIANHGDSDAVSMGRLGIDEARDDIRSCAETLYAICGVRPVYFSPHKGELTPEVLKAAALENSRVIMWTVDTVDWKLPGVDYMLNKILDQAGGGSLILMHPTAQSAEFLQQVIPALRAKGLEPVALSELLSPARAWPGADLR